MEAHEARTRINEHRAAIDALDAQLLKVLNERAGHALAIRELKPYAHMEHFDPTREDAIMSRLEELNEGPLEGNDIRELWGCLLRVMKTFKN